MHVVPRVSVLMPAHNAAAFVEDAVLSLLAQDYPADRLHLIAVDDGSTDETPVILDRLAAEHPTRITVIRQPNRGQVAAVNRAAELADGDYVALLDADDIWPADKITRQVAFLEEHRDVGLVYTDMRVIDAAGRPVEDSWLAGTTPPRGRRVAAFLAENVVMSSTILVRASLREHLFPIPDELPWPDWWLAVRCAQAAGVEYLPEPRTLYRFHGANMSLGAQGSARLGQLRKALALQRWFLRRLDAASTTTADFEYAWDAFERMAEEARAASGSPFAPLVDVTETDREHARALSGRAAVLLRAGAVRRALGIAVNAAACDPTCDATRDVLVRVRAAVPGGAGQQPLRGAHAVVIAVQGDELLHDPSLLGACAAALGDLDGVTLAIDVSTASAVEAVSRMEQLVIAAGLHESPLDVLIVTGPLDELGRARLTHGLTAVVGHRGQHGAVAWFPPERLDALRALAIERCAGDTSAAA